MPLSAEIQFLQRGAHISAGIAEILNFCRFLQKSTESVHLSAEILDFCRFLHKSAERWCALSADLISVEILYFCRKCAPLCRNQILAFCINLQRGTHSTR
jgi:hypothetical protein